MNVKETLEALAGRLQATGVRTVYGEPVAAHGRTIIPVARVAYGFGSGAGLSANNDLTPHGEGAGGGGGVLATPVGVVEIAEDHTRFLRFEEWRPLAAAAAVGLCVGIVLGKRGGRPSR
jgi:uncharacterized spore protein YtfJ